eukprot:CFRG1877T1
MAPVTTSEPSKEKEKVLVEKWNIVKARYAMDDALKAAIVNRGFVEDHTYTDVKLVTEVIAVSVAGVALYYSHFNSGPNVDILVSACVVIYFVLSGLVQLFQLLVTRSVIMRAHKEDTKGSSQLVTVRAYMEKQPPHMYTFSIELTSQSKKPKHPFKKTASIGDYIDERGFVHADKMESVVTSILSKFEE